VTVLEEFHDALTQLLDITELDGGVWGGPQARATAGYEAAWRELRARVDRLAPRAARAFDDAGITIPWQAPGTTNTYTINPGTEWRTILDRAPRVNAPELEACIRSAQGVLEDRIERPTPPSSSSAPFVRARRHVPSVAKWLAGVVAPVLAAGLIYLLGWK
jgi:hypothetical protein